MEFSRQEPEKVHFETFTIFFETFPIEISFSIAYYIPKSFIEGQDELTRMGKSACARLRESITRIGGRVL